jgi:hypothetical protein
MSARNEAGSFSVYLGSGVYVGGIVHADTVEPDLLLLDGAPSGQALSLAFVGRAASYGRAAAIRVCHVARRAGLGAWVVRHPVGVV